MCIWKFVLMDLVQEKLFLLCFASSFVMNSDFDTCLQTFPREVSKVLIPGFQWKKFWFNYSRILKKFSYFVGLGMTQVLQNVWINRECQRVELWWCCCCQRTYVEFGEHLWCESFAETHHLSPKKIDMEGKQKAGQKALSTVLINFICAEFLNNWPIHFHYFEHR